MRDGEPIIPEAVIIAVWNAHLDGDSSARISSDSWHYLAALGVRDSELSAAQVRRILAEPPPAAIEADLRYIHGVRAFWIAASGTVEDRDIRVEGAVFAFQPPRLTSKAFQKAVRAIRRDFSGLAPGGYFNPHVLEGIEMEAALRMLEAGRSVAWIIDEDGSITRYAGEFGPDAKRERDSAHGTPNP